MLVAVCVVGIVLGAPYEIVEEVPEGLPRIKEVRQVTQGPKHHFFGYYAICPWDATGRYLVCMETDFGDRKMTREDVAGICLIDTTTGELKRIAETSAWNFQQGALMHWVGDRPEIVYNDLVDEKLKAVVLNVHTGERRVLPRPITSVARDGSWAACINFGRLNTTRPGYGYPGVEDPYADEPHPKEDGLWRMDMDTGECTLIASLDDVYNVSPVPEEFAHKPMWMNLIIVSRDGGHAAFLSRYYGKKGWYTSLFTVAKDGSDLRCVIPYSWGGSHFDWADGERIIITTRLHGKQGGHVIFTNGKDDHRLLAPEVLKRDGHCHVSEDGRWMVTDSYPVGKERMQHFYVLDMETEDVALIGKFHEPARYKGDWRCDLHPRWSRDSRQVCIDSTHDGTRQVYVIELEMPDTAASRNAGEAPKASFKDFVMSAEERAQRDRVFDAAHAGDLEAVRAFIDEGGDPNLHVLLGDSLLCRAVAGQQVEVVRYLLAKGADPEMQGGSGKDMPLWLATRLRRSGAGNTARLDEIEALLQQAIAERLVVRPVDGALHTAIRSGDVSLVKKAVAKGADVNRRSKDGVSPLEMAVHTGNPALVETLFQAGARVHVGLQGQLEKGEITEIDPEARAEMERLFQDAHRAECMDLLRDLVREGAAGLELEGTHRLGYESLNDAANGSTLLMGAAAVGNVVLCEFLLELGVDPSVTDPKGDTAKDYVCREKGDEETKKRILALFAEYESGE